MGDTTRIEWADATFNPWIGCTKVAAECDYCYAERDFGVRFGVPWGKGHPRRRTHPDNWKKVRGWNREAERTGKRVRVFCASLADVFDPEVPDEWRMDLFGLISATPALDWLLLTKRPRVAHDFLTEANAQGQHWLALVEGAQPECWPFRNVTLGISAGTQRAADVGLPWLLRTPVHHRFVSAEPLLEELDLQKWFDPWTCADCEYHGSYNEAGPDGCCACGEHDAFGEDDTCRRCGANSDTARPSCPKCGSHRSYQRDYGFRFDNPPPRLDWVITGGESGPNARPMHPAWARKLCLQAQAAGTAFFFKQWGEWIDERQATAQGCAPGPGMFDVDGKPKGDRWHFYDGNDVIGGAAIRVGTKAAGNLLDGRIWEQLPPHLVGDR